MVGGLVTLSIIELSSKIAYLKFHSIRPWAKDLSPIGHCFSRINSRHVCMDVILVYASIVYPTNYAYAFAEPLFAA